MNKISRKQFLTKSSLALGGLSVTPMGRVWSRPVGANEAIRIGLVGLGWKGSSHVDSFSKLAGVRVVALCDVDQVNLDREVRKFQDSNEAVKPYRDIRHLLDDKDVDAVVIATPNHWHALMTIWACQAGKDVYVEKPVCHDIWEGLRMLDVERKYGRVIQGGTQNRSNMAFDEGVAFLREGHLGSITGIHGVRYK
ncbi:MAG: Gfo/Idh/MocA family oxidoreductase, partial [Verrucomicrobiales bacterium]|nr:Gfo/Idh/MocA family oxidoreductase [Verrucomicrobiales bacterium]